jgi:hypothetical protein
MGSSEAPLATMWACVKCGPLLTKTKSFSIRRRSDGGNLIRSQGSSSKLRDILSLVGAIRDHLRGHPSAVNTIPRHHPCNTWIRRSMSRSELNKWGETRILPSRMLTTTFSFRSF